MANFFTKLFSKNKSAPTGSPQELLNETLSEVIQKAGFNLEYSVAPTLEGFLVNLSGEDAALVTDREGQLIDSFQIFLKRMLQNKHPLEKIEIEVDCDGYLEASAQDLRELAEKLKNATLEKGQATYVRALPPRDRKVVHRYLSDDTRVRSQSVGEGFLKKVKISLVRSGIPAGATEDLSP